MTTLKKSISTEDDDDELLEFDMGDHQDPSPPLSTIPETPRKSITIHNPITPERHIDQEASSTAANETSEVNSIKTPVVTNHEHRLPTHPEDKPTTNETPQRFEGSPSVAMNHTKSSESTSLNSHPKKEHHRGLSEGNFSDRLPVTDEQVKTMNNPSVDKEESLSDEEDWQHMPTVASYEVYDSKGEKVVMKHEEFTSAEPSPREDAKYGYTRVTLDDDAKSVTSMDENTGYLFDEDDIERTPLSQLKATKDMLTEGQRIAYVGLCKLAIIEIAADLAQLRGSRRIAKQISNAQKELGLWAQMIMNRLYQHMDITKEGMCI